MSNVTTLVLHLGWDDLSKIEAVNAYMEHARYLPFQSIRDERGKGIGRGLFSVAVNHLHVDGLVWHLRKLAWDAPESVQLLVAREGDFKLRVMDLFPEAQSKTDEEDREFYDALEFRPDFSEACPENWHCPLETIVPNSSGWLTCPGCGIRFKHTDERVYWRGRHHCGQQIRARTEQTDERELE